MDLKHIKKQEFESVEWCLDHFINDNQIKSFHEFFDNTHGNGEFLKEKNNYYKTKEVRNYIKKIKGK